MPKALKAHSAQLKRRPTEPALFSCFFRFLLAQNQIPIGQRSIVVDRRRSLQPQKGGAGTPVF